MSVATAGRGSGVCAAMVGTGVLLQQLSTQWVEGADAFVIVATAGLSSSVMAALATAGRRTSVGAALGLVGTGVSLQQLSTQRAEGADAFMFISVLLATGCIFTEPAFTAWGLVDLGQPG